MKLKVKLVIKKLKLLFVILAIFIIFILYPIKTINHHTHHQTSFMNSSSDKSSPFSKWLSINKLPPTLICAVIKSEDKNFFGHHGLDLNAIFLGIKKYFQSGKLIAGSTITQQLAKNLYSTETRSLSSKIFETFQTFRLEAQLSKDEIFELYINSIELGEGLWGIENASWYYYGHSAKDLNLPESLLLSSIIASPRSFFKESQKNRLQNIYNRINYQLYISGIIVYSDYLANRNLWSKISSQLLNYGHEFNLRPPGRYYSEINQSDILSSGCGIKAENSTNH